MMLEPIDAVITWVDGHDILHQKKLQKCLETCALEYAGAVLPTRFNERGEINWCITSILHFAPWIRTIYIVTDSQVPPVVAFLKKHYPKKICVVDHAEIFQKALDKLPVFNSLAIETMFTHISGLSERFIYFNDDCVLLRPVSPEDFFLGHQTVLRGHWKIQTESKWFSQFLSFLPFYKRKSSINLHRCVQEKSALLAGYRKKFLHLPHAPFPLQKKTLQHFFEKHPEKELQNISYPFRNPKQFWPISLAHHIEIKEKKAIINNHLKTISFNGAFHSENKIFKRLNYATHTPNVAFLCMQSMDAVSNETWSTIKSWLLQHIPALNFEFTEESRHSS